MREIEIIEGLFLSSNYCVWYRPKDVVIVTDFHLGYESAMHDEGISLPEIQKEKILDNISDIKNRYQPETMIVLGDFKHDFGRSKDRVFSEILDVMDYMLEDSTLIMIKGNHDNYLKNYTRLKEVTLHEVKMKLDHMTLSHGHEEIEWEDLLMIGHEHPAIVIKDEVGSSMKFPCFLYDEEEKVLILPSIDPMRSGRDIITSSSFFSKSIASLEPANFHVYAISEDGLLDFHKVRDIRRTQPDFDRTR